MNRLFHSLIVRAWRFAIRHFSLPVPDLQRQHTVRPWRPYYYYCRIFLVVPLDASDRRRIRTRMATRGLYTLSPAGDTVPVPYDDIVCRSCPMRRLAIPCHKMHPLTGADPCLAYRYILVNNL